jgi:hypothetical protein
MMRKGLVLFGMVLAIAASLLFILATSATTVHADACTPTGDCATGDCDGDGYILLSITATTATTATSASAAVRVAGCTGAETALSKTLNNATIIIMLMETVVRAHA